MQLEEQFLWMIFTDYSVVIITVIENSLATILDLVALVGITVSLCEPLVFELTD